MVTLERSDRSEGQGPAVYVVKAGGKFWTGRGWSKYRSAAMAWKDEGEAATYAVSHPRISAKDWHLQEE